MSHELIVYWNRRLTRTPPLIARSPVSLDPHWLFGSASLSKIAGRRDRS